MKKSPQEQLTSDTKMSVNKDLLTAKEIIIIKNPNDIKKIDLNKMQKEVSELEKLKMALSLEQKLLLVTFAANLGIYSPILKMEIRKIFI